MPDIPKNQGGDDPVILTKEKIAEIKKKLDEMEGKEILPDQEIDISGDAAWYVAYKTTM